jgi:hypothetical protein
MLKCVHIPNSWLFDWSEKAWTNKESLREVTGDSAVEESNFLLMLGKRNLVDNVISLLHEMAEHCNFPSEGPALEVDSEPLKAFYFLVCFFFFFFPHRLCKEAGDVNRIWSYLSWSDRFTMWLFIIVPFLNVSEYMLFFVLSPNPQMTVISKMQIVK